MEAKEAQNIVLLGATSAIVHAAAREFAKEGAGFFLVGRNAQRLEANKGDLLARGAKECHVCVADLSVVSGFSAILKEAMATFSKLDFVLVGHGVLGDQEAAEKDLELAGEIIDINFVKQAQLVLPFAVQLETQKSGVLGVITSVAGVRGRPSNYVYGSAKAGMIAFLEGIRARLFKAGVRVIDIRPGIINTPMTEHLTKKPFLAEPVVVGRGINKAYHGKTEVVYLPGIWRYIMLVIKLLPRFVFNRASL